MKAVANRGDHRRRWPAIAAAVIALAVGGCEADRAGKLAKEDYEALLQRQPPPQAQMRAEPPIPDLAPIIAAPQFVDPIEQRLVSVSVTDAVPLKDLLQELARKAGIDLELDPEIQGGIIFSARERPFRQVIERISEMAALRHSLSDGILRVEVDRMRHETYRLDALNATRNASSTVQTSTNVFAGGGGSGGAAGNGSTSRVDSASNIDMWQEINDNIRQILVNTAPQPTVVVVPAVDVAIPELAPAARDPDLPAEMPGTAGAIAQLTRAVTGTGAAAPQAVATPPVPAARPRPASQPYFSINRQAGLVSVYGTGRQHEQLRKYLDRVQTALSTQVLIEAKIIEVSLKDEFRAGIDWSFMSRLQNDRSSIGFGIPLAGATAGSIAGAALPPPINLGLTIGNAVRSVTAALDFIQRFGTVRTLSNPRQTVVNNQTAVLKIAQNEVYFTVRVTPGRPGTATTEATSPTVNSEANTVPVGVVMTVQPVVDIDRGEITLNLRPTVTRIASTVEDPAVQLQAAIALGNLPTNVGEDVRNRILSITSNVPVLEVRELDSVVRVASGDIVLMGGLMQEREANTDVGLPGLQDVPVAGNAFKARNREVSTTELVILLQATVLKGGTGVDAADRDIYRKYFNDPRPVAF